MPPGKTPIEEFEVAEIDTSLLEEQKVIPIEKKKYSVVYIIKDPCYGGGCPSYEFSLLNDGVAFYKCKDKCPSVHKNYYAYIGREKAQEIQEYIQMYRLMELNSFYPIGGQPVANIPKTRFTLAIDDIRTKEITSFHHTPNTLIELENMVTQLINDTQWEPTYE